MKNTDKVTLTVGQLKKLIKEGTASSNSKPDTLTAIEETLSDVLDTLNEWHSEMDHALYSQLWDNVDQALAWVLELKKASQKEGA